MKNIITYTKLLIIILLASSDLLSQDAQSILQNIQIKENTGFIYMSSIPKDFQSCLSPNKTKIFINILDASTNGTNQEVHSTGLLQDIFTKQAADTIKITIIAKGRTGYTLIPLPYSKTLMVELFDWSKLNKAQDNYRKGLLAIENGIINPAKKSLIQASELGNPNAAANLALLQLYDGKIKSAFKNLLFANNLHTNIPDAYAGLSQIYKMYNMADKASHFSDIFTKMTGLTSFPEIIIGEIPADDSLDLETIKLLEKINQPISKIEKVENDTLNQKFKNILKPVGKKSIKKNTTWQVIKSFFPDWFFNYILVVIALAFLAAAALWFSYIKWKKIQMQNNDKTIYIDRPNFDKDLKNAHNSNAMKSHASNLYKENELKSEETTQSKIDKEKTENKNILDKNSIKSSNKQLRKPPITKKVKDENNFGNKIDKIAQQLIAAQKQQSLEQYEDNIKLEQKKEKESVDASTKLAKQLQSKKQKLKQQQLEKLSDELPKESDKIDELAKNLNLEKRTLKTKKYLSDLEKDTKSLDGIKLKFKEKNENNSNSD